MATSWMNELAKFKTYLIKSCFRVSRSYLPPALTGAPHCLTLNSTPWSVCFMGYLVRPFWGPFLIFLAFWDSDTCHGLFHERRGFM